MNIIGSVNKSNAANKQRIIRESFKSDLVDIKWIGKIQARVETQKGDVYVTFDYNELASCITEIQEIA